MPFFATMNASTTWVTRTWQRLLSLLFLLGLGNSAPAWAQLPPAEVEVRVPQAPQVVVGSDGLRHLAYELHITNFYPSTGTLMLKQLTVFTEEGTAPLTTFTAAQLPTLLAHPLTGLDTAAAGVPVAAGRRVVLFVWLVLPAQGNAVHQLRHQLVVETTKGERQLVDGVRTILTPTPTLVLGPPLSSGCWLAHEGPGNPHSHHWGSIVVANGQTTIPQRYAVDFFGLDATHHAVKIARAKLTQSAVTDWSGYGTPVLAVAAGVVRDLRDGEPNQVPLAPLPAPTALTVRGLMGNFVVLEIAPHVFVQYAHLLPGSLRVKVGERVGRGAVLGRVGQSGNANAPHLHFQVATAPTFEESEGLPFVFDRFTRVGTTTIGQVLDRAVPVSLGPALAQPRRQQLPLDGDVLEFK